MAKKSEMQLVSEQIISYVLDFDDLDILDEFNLKSGDFVGYEVALDFIRDYRKAYGRMPEPTFFASHTGLSDFEFFQMDKNTVYHSLDILTEQRHYEKTSNIIQTLVEKYEQNTVAAYDYLIENLNKLEAYNTIRGKNMFDISIDELKTKPEDIIKCPLEGMSEYLQEGGFNRGNELVALVADTGVGKTFISMQLAADFVRQGERVGMISPEMDAVSLRKRFDTVYNKKSFNELLKEYEDNKENEYMQMLAEKKPYFNVAELNDFQDEVTVSKIRAYIRRNKLSILFIDGISYIKGDKNGFDSMYRHNQLTMVSQQLKELSAAYKIPIFITVQANRTERNEEGRLTLRNIAESSGIARNATRVFALNWLKEEDEFGKKTFAIEILKNRKGISFKVLQYSIDFGNGHFELITNDYKNNTTGSQKSKGYFGTASAKVNVAKPLKNVDDGDGVDFGNNVKDNSDYSEVF